MCTLLMCCTTRVISEACATMTNMVKACGIIRLAERMPLEATVVAWALTFLRSAHKAIRMTPARAKTIVLVAIVVLSSPVREFPPLIFVHLRSWVCQWIPERRVACKYSAQIDRRQACGYTGGIPPGGGLYARSNFQFPISNFYPPAGGPNP